MSNSRKKKHYKKPKPPMSTAEVLKIVPAEADSEVRGTGLNWIPIDDFFLIPPYLVEQIEGRDYEVARLYEKAPEILKSPGCILGVFVDKQHIIQGFMWAGVNPLVMSLAVYALSVAKAFQGRGIVAEAAVILRALCQDLGLKDYVFYTKIPERFRSVGCIETGMVQMRST